MWQLAGALAAGIVGMLVAVPLAAAAVTGTSHLPQAGGFANSPGRG